ncbi:MAG: AAA family ATPase [Gammaproteobacteria bacterium]|nr:AAA family ATPase [Gammaproteobacteria bacterium]
MYNAYFNFKEAPFSIAPDPRYLYMTEQHREALAHLVYGLNSEGGCILLTGEVGTGKTTVCRCLLEQIPEHTNIALVVNPKVTAIELLETICDELKIEYPSENNTIKTYIDLINAFLIEANARNEKTVLIIDEAQNLDNTVLEQLRLLTNLETNQRKLLQIIILGQPELLDILARQEMRQLAQRITARFHLNALSRNEVKAYINHRLAIAGQNAQLFPETTISQLYRLSKGIPRLLNVLCDRSLLGTYVQNKPIVDTKTLSTAAKEVFGELKQVQNKSKLARALRITAITSVTAIAAALIIMLLNNKLVETASSTETVSRSSTQQEKLTGKETTLKAPAIDGSNQIQAIAEKTEIQQLTLKSGIENLPTTNANQTITDPINDYIFTSTNKNKETAFSTLLMRWHANYTNKTNAPVCNDPAHGLSCFNHRGNLNSLRKLNRPVVLKLYNDDGKVAYLVLNHLNKNQATLNTGQETLEIDTSLIDKHWYGEFSLLWQAPPFYQKTIIPGSNGEVVQWLGQQLTRLYNHSNTPTIYDTYSEELVALLKRFQQSKGLIPDGIAGPLTLIHLNTEIGQPTPLLNKRPEDES